VVSGAREGCVPGLVKRDGEVSILSDAGLWMPARLSKELNVELVIGSSFEVWAHLVTVQKSTADH
jgi:hypothetical protein